MNKENGAVLKLPLWKSCLDKMREDGLSYGKSWRAEFFEKHLRCTKDSSQFAFEMLSLKQVIEDEDGYYLRSSESGELYEIPAAIDHETVAKCFEHKMRRYALRSIGIRGHTLQNPNAELTAAERARIESNMERASIRFILITRQKSVEKLINEKQPKLLKK